MKKRYDFDQIIVRDINSGSSSIKWQDFDHKFPGYDVQGALGMWIADMDFLCPTEVITAVKKRAEHGIYGYVSPDAIESFKSAAAGWFSRRYGLKTYNNWMLFILSVVPAINAAIQEFTEPGDGVIVQSPVYYPFFDSIKNCGRTICNNQLINNNGYYQMNYEELEKLARDPNTKLFILCNPHNPVGRVWSEEELSKACKICTDNGVLIFSDEIHADMIMKGQKFFSAGKLPSSMTDNMLISFAPSKTFNIAGLAASLIVISNEGLRKRLANRMETNNYPGSNVFAPIAGETAYLYGDTYVEELTEYIENNFDYAVEFLKENLPEISMKKPEGTYLGWLDFSKTGLDYKKIYGLVLEKAKIAAGLGEWFGAGGEYFMRFNFACPKSIVEMAMHRLKGAFQNS